MARRKNPQIHHVDFAKVNRRWVAYIYIDPNTTISQQTVGSKKNVDKIIKTQLEPQGIPYTIEGMTEMTNYPTYMVKAGLVPNSRHGSYPGDTGKIPKTKAAFKKEYFDLLTQYFSTRQYIGAGKYEKPTAKSLRIADRLAELYDAHPDWADQTDEEWADDQRMNRPAEIWSNNPRRKNGDAAWEIAAKVAKAAHAAMKGGGRWDLGYTPSVVGKRMGDPIQKSGTIYISHEMVDDPIGDYSFVMPLPRNLTESQLKNKLYPMARRWPVLGAKGGLPSVKVLRQNTRRKKSNPRNRKLAIELPGTNLYVVGVGYDTNGNGVIRFKTPSMSRSFAIQTAGWPDLHKVRSDLFAMAKIPSKDLKAFTQTATDYIKYYGSPAQKKSLRVYKSNTKRRKKSNPHCKVNGCHNKVRSNGMCGKHNNPSAYRYGDLSVPHGLSKAEEKRVRAQIQQDLVAAFMRALDEYAPSTIDKNKIVWGSRLLDAYKSSPNAVGFYAVKERYFGGHSASAKARKWLNNVSDSRWDTIIRAAAKEAIARHKAKSNPRRRSNSKALWSRNKWRIEWYDPQAKWRGFYVVGETHADHPTVYSLRRVGAETQAEVGYDRPGAVPKYVQAAVSRLAVQYADDLDLRRPNPKRRNGAIDAEILSTYARGRRAKFGQSDIPMPFKRMRRNSKASRSNLVFFMETRGGKYNVKVYKVGKKYEMVVHERGQADLTAQTTSKAELSAIVGQFYRVGYMSGTAKYKVKHDALGLGIE